MSFLQAEWRKLAIANDMVERSILQPYIPFGTEFDLWNGQCYVSLVGFMFKNTKLLGIKIPFHVNFEEVNLRFYVRRFDNGNWKRGVVFIREIVPKWALTFIANTVYQEHYVTMPMAHRWEKTSSNQRIEYSWKKSGRRNMISVTASKESFAILPGSESEFITEHYWGYTRINDEKSNEYEVTHPRWNVYQVDSYDINVDFGLNYGDQFAFLSKMDPHSVMLAEGSEITVENKRSVRKY